MPGTQRAARVYRELGHPLVGGIVPEGDDAGGELGVVVVGMSSLEVGGGVVVGGGSELVGGGGSELVGGGGSSLVVVVGGGGGGGGGGGSGRGSSPVSSDELVVSLLLVVLDVALLVVLVLLVDVLLDGVIAEDALELVVNVGSVDGTGRRLADSSVCRVPTTTAAAVAKPVATTMPAPASTASRFERPCDFSCSM